MLTVTLEIVLLLALVAINGLLSMSEIAIVSARTARLQRLADDGDHGARAALTLASDPTSVLSTVQVGITLIGILAGAIGGAAIAEHMTAGLTRLTGHPQTSESIAVAIVVVAITFLSVVVGELVPKRLALGRPERIAAAVAVPMRWLTRLAYPVVRILNAATHGLLRLVRIDTAAEPAVTEDDLRLLIRHGGEAGLLDQAEQHMLEQVLRLGDRRADALMTPRHEVVWIDLDDPPAESLRTMAVSGHAYFPVGRGNRDEPLGIVSVKQLWGRAIEGRSTDLAGNLIAPVVVPERVTALKLLELFKQANVHVAVVVDEYGGFQGIVTLNDVLGAIVGDVVLSDVPADPPIVRRDDGTWLVDGMLALDAFKEAFALRRLPGEAADGFQTMGGFVMSQLGRIPRPGDRFQWQRLRFEVMDMDGLRVDKVLVSPADPAPPVARA